MSDRSIDAGEWLNPPLSVERDGEHLLVTAREASDFWRTTSYSFVHDSGHGLLNPFVRDTAIEVSWHLDYTEQFDQAGVLVWSDDHHWIKAGVEFADGAPQLGAVVTRDTSDWSVAPVPSWQNQVVDIRASWVGDALTVRARCDGPWQLVRLAPLDPTRTWRAGLFCASPSRGGLTVRFLDVRVSDADITLH